ncbi:hypothetical protein THOG05_350031 [Vibrio rotiferianus]|nr:hypothetical protein THOG05_350031 [Vibrio rotiferianus]CAH1585488.1 hypothetical protein THOE12_80030 [Vibrio rotiferianus]
MLQYLLMASVYAIEIANSQYATVMARLDIVNTSNQFHWILLSASVLLCTV